MSGKITIKKQESATKCGVCPKHNYNQENDIYSVTFNHNSNQGTIVNLCLNCMDDIAFNLKDFVEKEIGNKILRFKKFKVGNQVKIKDNLIVDHMYGDDNFIEPMEKYKGNICTIDQVYSYGYILSNCDMWNFTDEMLELYEGE